MTRGDIALSGSIVAILLVAAVRASALWHNSNSADNQPASVPLQTIPAAPIPASSVSWVRPLFRQPGSVPQSDPSDDKLTTAGVASKAQSLRLIGVIINERNRIAIVDYGGKTQRLEESSKLGAWTLKHIDRRSITIENGSESRLLKLDPVP
jgi:type II secretory pathway component PulC